MASAVVAPRMLSVVTLSVDLMDVSELVIASARADIPRPDSNALNDARRWVLAAGVSCEGDGLGHKKYGESLLCYRPPIKKNTNWR